MSTENTLKVNRPILRYYGGKWLTAPWIIEHFPEHRTYVEPFGGGASVLLQKSRSYAEVYNDIDEDVVNVFRVVRDYGPDIQKRIFMTPFSRKEHELAYDPAKDPIERARRTILKSFLGFGSDSIWRKSGFRANTSRSGSTPAKDWMNFPKGIPGMVERLRGVVIECIDALELIERYKDIPDTLIYVDPPYSHSTRVGGERYGNEISDDDHIRLAGILKNARARVIVSGYYSDLYGDLYNGWSCDEKRVFAQYSNSAKKAGRTEVIWANFKFPNSKLI